MEIIINYLSLKNFKGARDLQVAFGSVTTISGDNGTFKTSLFDAFTWLLFGKNSEDEKDFEIKTLDKDNNPLHKLEHEVSAGLTVDGREVKLKRIYMETWEKKRGEEIATWTGHETRFFVDDVPLKQAEYKARIDFMVKEDLFKLITNPLFFNSNTSSWKWNNRRTVLDAMAGEISATEIMDKIATLQNKQEIMFLTNELNGSNETNLSKKIEAIRKKIGAKKKLLKDTLPSFPIRIDEVKKTMPEPQDYDGLQEKINAKTKEITTIETIDIAAIETQMQNKSAGYETEFEAIRVKQQELNDLKVKQGQAEVKNKSAKANKLTDLDGQISNFDTVIRNSKLQHQMNVSSITQHKSKIIYINGENDKLRDRWTAENAKTLEIDETKFNCTTCGQKLPKKDIDATREKMTANFNTNKMKVLEQIDQDGVANRTSIGHHEEEILKLEATNATLFEKITTDESAREKLAAERIKVDQEEVKESKEVKDLKKQIEKFIVPPPPVIDNTELKQKIQTLKDKISTLRADISGLTQLLQGRDQIVKINARVQELEKEERTQSQQLANLEKIEFTIDAFSRARIETTEARINGMFGVVKFKMFQQQINGGEDEICECMVHGVPYGSVNTAGKINAGIDIINALTKHYRVNAPVWIDNRESVIRLIPCQSQIINLVAVKGSSLTVTTPESREFAL